MPAQCQKVKGKCQLFGVKHRTQALVNGGRNYNGPKVKRIRLALVKPNYMRETPQILLVLVTRDLLRNLMQVDKCSSKNLKDMWAIRRKD